MERRKRMIVIDEERCTVCGVCAAGCPQEAISLSDYTAVVDHERCTGCGVCVAMCAQDAICQVLDPEAALTPTSPDYVQASGRYRPPTTQRASAPSLARPLLGSAWAWALPLATKAAAGLVGRWLGSRASARSPSRTSRALFRPGAREMPLDGPRNRGTPLPLFGGQYPGGRRRRWRGGRWV
jgi:Pyruvate/2-oxoacid:ferredoxin oxidoreductase delta subunit